MRVQCPGCKQTLQAPESAVGKKAQCKGCRNVFVIPPPAPRLDVKSCPNCRVELDATAVLCFACGLNLQTGRMPAAPAPVEAPPVEEEERPSLFVRTVECVGEYLPGIFRPWIIVLSGVLTIVALVVMGFCVALALLGTLIEACMVGGLGLIIYGQALAMLLVGETGLLHELLAELDGKRWMLFFLMLFSPFVILYFVIHAFMAR